jgi:hypothetical protein
MKKTYDFTNGVRGKYYKRYSAGTNLVAIDPDLLKTFPNSDAVNAALRNLVTIARQASRNVAAL